MGFKPTNGGGIDQLTGEVTAGPGTGSQAATIAPVTTAGSIGGATAVPEITYNAAGQITGVASIAPDDTSKVPLSTVTAAGDLIVGSGAGAVSRLGIGANGDVLTVASGALSYAAPASGSLNYGSGGLTTAVTLNASSNTQVFAIDLAVGTYLLTCSVGVNLTTGPTANEAVYMHYLVNTGTATINPGFDSYTVFTVADATSIKTLTATQIVVVTASAQIAILIGLGAEPGNAGVGASAYTWVQIA